MRAVGTSTKGSTVRLAAASRQSLSNNTRSSPTVMKNCRSMSARMCEVATWILSMSFMMDDINRPVEWVSKNSAPWRITLSKTV